jgi:hypothetical protein
MTTVSGAGEVLYTPAPSGFPTYFAGMVQDVQRNLQYEAAIHETIQDFQREQKRRPRVLDLGSGLGLLSMMCLRHGAAHVTLLEANTDLSDVSKSCLEASLPQIDKLNPDRGTYDFVRRMSSQFHPKQPYDMLVCELMGQALNSESMFQFTQELLQNGKVRGFAASANGSGSKKYYTVPQSGFMQVRVVDSPKFYSLPTQIPYIDVGSAFQAVFALSRPTLHPEWRIENDNKKLLGFVVAPGTDASQESEPHRILTEVYNAYPGRSEIPRAHITLKLNHTLAHSPEAIVQEWVAQLSRTVKLVQTLEEFRQLSPQNQFARVAHWPFNFLLVADFQKPPTGSRLLAQKNLALEVFSHNSRLTLRRPPADAKEEARAGDEASEYRPPGKKTRNGVHAAATEEEKTDLRPMARPRRKAASRALDAFKAIGGDEAGSGSEEEEGDEELAETGNSEGEASTHSKKKKKQRNSLLDKSTTNSSVTLKAPSKKNKKTASKKKKTINPGNRGAH